jgi:hypothetical protein
MDIATSFGLLAFPSKLVARVQSDPAFHAGHLAIAVLARMIGLVVKVNRWRQTDRRYSLAV